MGSIQLARRAGTTAASKTPRSGDRRCDDFAGIDRRRPRPCLGSAWRPSRAAATCRRPTSRSHPRRRRVRSDRVAERAIRRLCFANLRSVFQSLDNRGRYLLDRFLNRVEDTAIRDPLSYEFDFFLAHSTQDAQITDALYQGLLARSTKVFLDNRSLAPGDLWPDRLLVAQKASKVTIALVSENSVKSHWFKSECITAISLLNSGLPHALVPVLLDASEMPYGTNIVQGIALYNGVSLEAGIDKLMMALADVSVTSQAATPA